MADFETGDRVVKMSGNWAGRYGTVNSVGESGTLNVTFDGERLPKYCDPALCGKVAANAKFKVGDKVVWLHFHSDSLSNETIKDVWKDGTYRVDSGLVSERELYPGHVAKEAEGVTGMRDIGGGRFASPHLPNKWFDLNGRVGANACAANGWSGFKPGDKVSIGGRAGRERGEPVEIVERVEGDKQGGFLYLKGHKFGVPARMYALANAAEGELRALTEKAKEWAESARAQGDAKTVSNIARGLSLLKNAVRNAEVVANENREMDVKESIQKLARVASKAAGMPATATYKWTNSGIGYIDIKFPDKKAAEEFNYYDAIYAIRDAKSAFPKWAWAIDFRVPQVVGSTVRIWLGNFAT